MEYDRQKIGSNDSNMPPKLKHASLTAWVKLRKDKIPKVKEGYRKILNYYKGPFSIKDLVIPSASTVRRKANRCISRGVLAPGDEEKVMGLRRQLQNQWFAYYRRNCKQTEAAFLKEQNETLKDQVMKLEEDKMNLQQKFAYLESRLHVALVAPGPTFIPMEEDGGHGIEDLDHVDVDAAFFALADEAADLC